MEKSQAHVLAIDDDTAVRSAVKMLLNQHFTKVSVLGDPALLPDWLESFIPDVVILDMNFTPGMVEGREGIKWLEYLQKHHPGIIVIMITAFGDIELAVKAVRKGAFDFIIKPWSNQKMISTIHASLKLAKSQKKIEILESKQEELNRHWLYAQDQLIGLSPSMKRIKDLITKIAPTLADVLILPSFKEVWGLVVNEALASGIYVLCSNYAGAAYDLIKEGWDGIRFNPHSIEELITLIRKAKEQIEDIRARRQAISEHACQEFSIECSAKAFSDAVEAVISNKA